MDLKDYKEMPEDGLFEKIQRKLAVRRATRIGGAVLGAVAVIGTAAVLMWPQSNAEVATMASVQPLAEETAVVVEPAAAPTIANTAEPVANKVAKSAATAEPVQPAAVVDEHAYLAAMLPQGMPVVQTLDESSAESGPIRITNGVPLAGQTVVADTTSPATGTNTSKADKAGQPMAHYDNVIWAPNVIIPDGEVDENRTFTIKATSAMTDFKLHIYNRNGRRIYLTADPAFAWDGTMNGERVPQGAYVWVATFRDTDGVPRQERGTVTVLR